MLPSKTSTTTPIQVPPPAEIRERLRAIRDESRTLRRLLKLSEAAYQANEARRKERSNAKGS